MTSSDQTSNHMVIWPFGFLRKMLFESNLGKSSKQIKHACLFYSLTNIKSVPFCYYNYQIFKDIGSLIGYEKNHREHKCDFDFRLWSWSGCKRDLVAVFNKPKTLYPTHHLYLYPFQGADTILRKLVEVHSQALWRWSNKLDLNVDFDG